MDQDKKKPFVIIAKFVSKKININLKIRYDKSKPNGTPRKKLDSNLAMKYGWKSKFDLMTGFDLTYKDF